MTTLLNLTWSRRSERHDGPGWCRAVSNADGKVLLAAALQEGAEDPVELLCAGDARAVLVVLAPPEALVGQVLVVGAVAVGAAADARALRVGAVFALKENG